MAAPTIKLPDDIHALNLGCGDTPREGFWNVDIASRTGVDAVFDLAELPWPLPENRFSEVHLIDVLEHLPDTIGTIGALWRVCQHDALVLVRVPYWNSRWAWMDPQQVRVFHENTFDFFDPSKKYCQQRPYYSQARFHIEEVEFEGCWFLPRWPWRWRVPENQPRRLLHAATKLCDMVHFLNFRLRAIKDEFQ